MNYLTINKDNIGKKKQIINIKQKLAFKNDKIFTHKNNSESKEINENFKKEKNDKLSSKKDNILTKSENINNKKK